MSRRRPGGRLPDVHRLVFPAPRPATPVPGHLSVQQLPGGGAPPAYLLHQPAQGDARTVVYLHGNGSDLGSIAPLGEVFTRRGLGFAAAEYPGYGPAFDQRSSEAGAYDAADRVLAHLRDEVGVDRSQLVLVGESLGTAVAVEMALRGHGGRLVLLSAFTSMTQMFRRRMPRYPRRFVPGLFDTIEKAERLDVPTLLVHGADDRMVPPAMSEALADRIPQARRVLVLGRDHNTLWEAPSRTAELVLEHATG